MTKADLRTAHSSRGYLFFSRPNMAFAGDTMANFDQSVKAVRVQKSDGKLCRAYRLTRRRPTSKTWLDWRRPIYFDARTFRRIYGTEI